MSAMAAEDQGENYVPLLIPNVPESLRIRIRIAAARKKTTMQKLELEALTLGLDILAPETEEGSSGR